MIVEQNKLVKVLLDECEINAEDYKQANNLKKILYDLANSKADKGNYQLLDKLCHKIDAIKKVYSVYDSEFKQNISSEPLNSSYLDLLASILIVYSIKFKDPKFLNSACKIIDRELRIPVGSELKKPNALLLAELERVLDAVISFDKVNSVVAPHYYKKLINKREQSVIINAMVLVYDSPKARAYISMMDYVGIRPKKIILMNHKASTKFVRFIDKIIGNEVSARLKRVLRGHSTKLHRLIGESLGIPIKWMNKIKWSEYAEEFDSITVNNIKDPKLEEFIKEQEEKTVIYTGGGILSRSLLETTGKKFIHVHPGELPHVRGGDCLFWSLLVRGTIGMSCFYMDPGIDTGSVIKNKSYPFMDIKGFNIQNFNSITVHKALAGILDNFLRSIHLIGIINETINNKRSLADFDAISQVSDEGRTYYFMSSRFKRKVNDKLKIKFG